MNKSDLINALKERAGLSRKDSEVVVDTFFGSITESMAAGDRVEIRGFGSFRISERKAREGRNPKTGEAIQIPARRVIQFRPGKQLNQMINGETSP